MKKLLSLGLVVIMAVGMVACSKPEPVIEPIIDPIKDGDDTSIANPFIEVKTLEEAEKITGFSLVVPEKLAEDMVESMISVMDKEMIEVVYNNKEKDIIIRKAKGKEDISGDYNKYDVIKEEKIGDREVTLKGNGKLISVATWTEGEFVYSVVVSYESWAPDVMKVEEMGIEENVMIELVKNIK